MCIYSDTSETRKERVHKIIVRVLELIAQYLIRMTASGLVSDIENLYCVKSCKPIVQYEITFGYMSRE